MDNPRHSAPLVSHDRFYADKAEIDITLRATSITTLASPGYVKAAHALMVLHDSAPVLRAALIDVMAQLAGQPKSCGHEYHCICPYNAATQILKHLEAAGVSDLPAKQLKRQPTYGAVMKPID